MGTEPGTTPPSKKKGPLALERGKWPAIGEAISLLFCPPVLDDGLAVAGVAFGDGQFRIGTGNDDVISDPLPGDIECDSGLINRTVHGGKLAMRIGHKHQLLISSKNSDSCHDYNPG